MIIVDKDCRRKLSPEKQRKIMAEMGENIFSMSGLNKKDLESHLAERIPDMAKILSRGRDVEVRTDPKTVVRVISVDKAVVKSESNIP